MPTAATDCPNCGQILSVPPGARSGWLRCPGCSARFLAEGRPAPVRSLDRTRPPQEWSLSELATRDSARPLADADRMVRSPLPPRPPISHGDARRRARRCASCDGHVPVGMSICPVCGYDQETRQLVGGRIRVIEPEAERLATPPLGVYLLSWTSIAFGIGLATVTALRPDLFGWVLIPPIAVLAWLATYGGIQLVRGFRVRPIAMALVLAAVLDVTVAFVVPLFLRRGEELDHVAAIKMGLGTFGLLTLTLAAVYLGTENVRRFFAERRPLFVKPEDEDEWLGGYTTTI